MAVSDWDREKYGDHPGMDDSAASSARQPEKLNHGERARSKDAQVNAHDSRTLLVSRRCQRDNVLMEAVGVMDMKAGYYCSTCSTIQLRPLLTP